MGNPPHGRRSVQREACRLCPSGEIHRHSGRSARDPQRSRPGTYPPAGGRSHARNPSASTSRAFGCASPPRSCSQPWRCSPPSPVSPPSPDGLPRRATRPTKWSFPPMADRPPRREDSHMSVSSDDRRAHGGTDPDTRALETSPPLPRRLRGAVTTPAADRRPACARSARCADTTITARAGPAHASPRPRRHGPQWVLAPMAPADRRTDHRDMPRRPPAEPHHRRNLRISR
jgi:hypothetical protein